MKKYYLLLTIIFCTNYIFANHPMLEKANDGPRWLKTSTIIDCRSIRENSIIPSGKIVMEIEDYIVGETQSWKRRIGILKAKFRVG